MPANERSGTEIVLVDDDAVMRTFLERALVRAGYPVRAVGSGKDALRSLAEAPARLVIMEEMDGIELIIKLRRQSPGTEIIAMSGGGSIKAEDCLTLASGLGARRALTKPFTLDEMIEAIDSVTTTPA